MWFTLQTWHPCFRGYSRVLDYPISTKLKYSISASESSYQVTLVLENAICLYICYWPQNIELLSWLLLPKEMVVESNIEPSTVVLQHQGEGRLRWNIFTARCCFGKLSCLTARRLRVWFQLSWCAHVFPRHLPTVEKLVHSLLVAVLYCLWERLNMHGLCCSEDVSRLYSCPSPGDCWDRSTPCGPV